MSFDHNVILQQLGGQPRLNAFVGGHSYAVDREEGFLRFGFRGSRHSNTIVIRYDFGMDLYTVEFWKIGKTNFKKVSEFDNVGGEQLVELFESQTGLTLGLGFC